MATRSGNAELKISFGMRNCADKYMTVETFQSKLCATAGTMKKKQIFFLESVAGKEGIVFIRSHINKFLRVDSDGNFKADADDKTDEAGFEIQAQPDGKWAFKSVKYGWYAGGTGEDMRAFTTEIDDTKLFTINLAMHPQICLRNDKRDRYVHLSDSGDSLTTDEDIPWGEDAMLTLKFFGHHYGIQASNGKYLSSSGELKADVSDDVKFVLVFTNNAISLQAASGKFVTSLGATGVLRATKGNITRDEQYHMEDSHPQIKLTSSAGKKVSIKGGIEVAANSKETTDNEIFQIEPVGDKWALKTAKSKYFVIEGDYSAGSHVGNNVHSNADDKSAPATHFEIEWHGHQIALKADNGMYVGVKSNGYVFANAADVGEHQLFVYELVNRPKLILRGEYGFIGRTASGILEVNKSEAESFDMHVTSGKCKISSADGQFWTCGADGISATGANAELYDMEIYKDSMLALKFEGKYFQGNQNGALTCTGTKLDKSTLFEY